MVDSSTTMQILGFGDPHIKPVSTSVDYEKLTVPDGTDMIVCTGDVIHDIDDASLDAGRTFLDRLNEFEIPIIYVPGNHDPVEYYSELAGELQNVVCAHKKVITGQSVGHLGSDPTCGHCVIGWGCEGMDQRPKITLTDFPSLDPQERAPRSERRHAADTAAQELEDAVATHILGNQTLDSVCTSLDIEPTHQTAFRTQLQTVQEVFETVSSLFESATTPIIVVSHVPPYNTRLDRHHSLGEREVDLEGLHVGSLGLKLALRHHQPIAALSGHSHTDAYHPGIGDANRPHMLNLDFRGVSTITLDGSTNQFGYTFHQTS